MPPRKKRHRRPVGRFVPVGRFEWPVGRFELPVGRFEWPVRRLD